jgi:hypothetical protein
VIIAHRHRARRSRTIDRVADAKLLPLNTK